MAENPLIELREPFPFPSVKAEHIGEAIRAHLDAAERAIVAIEAATAPTYDAVLGALDRATAPLEHATVLCEHLESVHTYPEWRTAWGEAEPLVSAFWSGIPLRPALYAALRKVREGEAFVDLPAVMKRHLEKTIASFERSGAGLSDADKARLTEIDVALTKLTTKFSQNVLDATAAFELIVEDEGEVAGLPPFAKDAARASAESKGKNGYRFTLQAPSFIPAVTYATHRPLREELYRAYNERASAPPFDNRPILREVLALRHEKALLLGAADFADWITKDRMAKSGKRAGEFVEDLVARTRAAFERDRRELRAFAEAAGAPEIAAWDVAHLAELQRRAKLDFDEESLRPYFPLHRVLSGALDIFGSLFEVRFIQTELPTWDASVLTYRLEDGRSGATLATVYVDLFPRENKTQGAWMAPLLAGAPPTPHVAVVAGNFTPPLGDRPALLSHREVETLFHELGHLMHQCLSRVPVRKLGGTNVAWDFVELPSQIMENWTWERAAIDRFAGHYETGEPLPEELFQRLRSAQTYRAASVQMQQLGYATLDLDLHRRPGEADPTERAREILAQHVTAPLPPSFAMIASFGHLFGSPTGYASGYYAYKWAEVLDADAFGRFRDEGIFNPKVGAAFRDAILERGDSADPETLFADFRGREPRVDALLMRLGLTSS